MPYKTILVKKEDNIATVTLNRPEVLNAITPQMFKELVEALADIDEDNDIRVMILTGAGRAFCASADLNEESKGKEILLADKTIEEGRQFIRHFPQRVTKAIIDLEKPTIAMVNGVAIGDGFDWVLACDLRVASTNARFMNAFVRMALVSNTGANWLYPKLMGLTKAFELLYTGDWLEAEEANKLGLLNKLVPPEELQKETMALAKKLARQPPIALRMTKMHVYRGLGMSLHAALELAADGEIMTLKTKDHEEALAAFRGKRQPVFKGE